MFELTRRNNNHHINTYNPFRELEEFERNFFSNPFGIKAKYDNGVLKLTLPKKEDVLPEGRHPEIE